MKQIVLLTATISVLFFGNSVIAQNYNDALLLSEPGLYTGARALSMGNSFTSLSDDISGLLFNPAPRCVPAASTASRTRSPGTG